MMSGSRGSLCIIDVRVFISLEILLPSAQRRRSNLGPIFREKSASRWPRNTVFISLTVTKQLFKYEPFNSSQT
jgi:hypothetical protein